MLEGGQFYSATMRDILARYHGVVVGAYSYGECMNPGEFPPGVTIGRYVSVARDVRVFRRNHPYDRASTHPFFFDSALGMVEDDNIVGHELVIEHDAWIGERAIITPGCSRIGLGAVVGAGAVVTRDVPDFAIVVGNPARLIRYRFPEHIRRLLTDSHWWERPHDKWEPLMVFMTSPLDVSVNGFPHGFEPDSTFVAGE